MSLTSNCLATLHRLEGYWCGIADECERGTHLSPLAQWWSFRLTSTEHDSEHCKVNTLTRTVEFTFPQRFGIEPVNALVREFLCKSWLSASALVLHGSCFARDRRAFVVIGPKGAGKTTWLLRALARGRHGFVCNDTVPLFLQGRRVYTRACRPDIKIARESLSLALGENSTVAEDKAVWYCTETSRRAADTQELSEYRGQRIGLAPMKSVPVCHSPGLVRVEGIVQLEKSDHSALRPWAASSLFARIRRMLSDKENLIPEYLAAWEKAVPFWRRVVGLNPPGDVRMLQRSFVRAIVADCKLWCIGSRIGIRDMDKALLSM